MQTVKNLPRNNIPGNSKIKWEMDAVDGRYYAVFEGGEVIADCFDSKENALLIAKAPAMYEVLKAVCNARGFCGSRDFWDARKKARELLEEIGDDMQEH